MKRNPVIARQLAGREQDPTYVGVQIDPHDRLVGRLLERFAELRWQVIDLNAFNLRLPGQLKIAGALLRSLSTEPLARQLLERGVPTVRLGRLPHPDDFKMPAVIPDQVATGRLAAEHFAERGFVHLGFVGYNPWAGQESLYESFRARAAELNCHCHLLTLDEHELRTKVTAEHHYYDVQRQYVHGWWRTLPRPLGLLAGNDNAAHRFCQWAIQAGLRVPEDIAILSVGNIVFTCEGAIVPISSIDPNDVTMLDIAIDTLHRLTLGEKLEQSTRAIAPRAVVTRRSTDVLAASDGNVVKALQFMWDHITEDLSVDQIVAHVGVSRRTLEVGFRREIGRGINAEFQRRRLEKGRELLLRTDWGIGQIAEFLGFSELKYFSKAFHAAYGTSPIRYRLSTQPAS